ncbi:MAG: hypothetical protein C5B45_06175 [Chlamydiae bacterium]|nr:MAG: hypothetical protein C5B45_06175 [Chlamydiota bacterium]
MSSIVTSMNLTSYNPYKEAITMLIGGTEPYLISHLPYLSSLEALYPKLTALEKLFLKYARDFLSLQKKTPLLNILGFF